MIKKILIYLPWMVLVSTGLFFIVTTSPYIRYWVDDFCSAAFLKNNGFWGAQTGWWKSWTGRYSAVFFTNLFESIGPWVIKTLPILLFVLLIIGTKKLLFNNTLLASLFIILVLANSPNIIQTFYWQTGALNYLIPFVFLNFALWPLFQDKKTSIAVPLILSVIAGGFSEAFAIAAFVFLIYLVFVVFIAKPKNRKQKMKILAAATLGISLSLLIMFLSPGNKVRGVSVTNPESISYVLKWTVLTTKWYLARMFSIRSFIYTLGILFSAAFLFAKKKTINIKKGLVVITATLVVLFGITAAVISSGYYSMSIIPPERTLSIIFYGALVLMFIFFYVLCMLLNKFLKGKLWNKILTLVVILNLVSTVLLGKSIILHWSGVKNEISSYANSWDVEVKNLPEIHNIKPVGELDSFTDNKGWVSSCISGYYGLENVTIIE